MLLVAVDGITREVAGVLGIAVLSRALIATDGNRVAGAVTALPPGPAEDRPTASEHGSARSIPAAAVASRTGDR